MADLPDFWQSSVVNIITQDLPEIINRPKYGNAQWAFYNDTIPVDLGVNLCVIAGKGITYAGVVVCDGATGSHADDCISFDFDHEGLYSPSFFNLNRWAVTKQPGVLGCLGAFDDTNYIYSIILPYGITFETVLRITYYNMSATPAPVKLYFIYALI